MTSRLLFVASILAATAIGQALTINDTDTSPLGFVDLSMTGGTPIPDVQGNSSHHIVTTIGNTLFPAGDVLIADDGVVIAGLTSGAVYAHMPIGTSGIPSGLPAGGDAYIAAYWDNFNSLPGMQNSTIWWQEFSGTLIIMWKDVAYSPPVAGETITFEIQIRPASLDCGPSIQLLYLETFFGPGHPGNDGQSATIGYASPLANAPWSYNSSSSISNGNTLSIQPSLSDDLAFTSPLGPGSVQLYFVTCTATEYLLAVTLSQGAYPNGWLYGLDIPVTELVHEIAIGAPFTGFATGMPDSHTLGPFSGLPPVTLYTLVLGFKNSTLVGHSDAVAYTIP